MNILIIHNYYSVQGGEESVVAFQKKLLESKGHNVLVYSRDYHEMKQWKWGKIGGLITSIYNRKSINDINRILDDFNPEIALTHNLFPIISPAIIPFLKKKGVRVYQVVHNYRLFCPIGIFYNKHRICHKCLQAGREWNCLFHKCNQSIAASFSYACRAYFVRKLHYFKSVSKFIVLSDFQKQILIENGYHNIPIEVIPNSIPDKISLKNSVNDLNSKKYIGFIGRLTEEKGLLEFIKLAEMMPELEFRIAGNQNNVQIKNIPSNIFFEGFLAPDEIDQYYKNAKLIIVPSKWLEVFGLVLIEAFSNYTPVIASKVGGMIDIIQHEENGYLVEVGDIESMKKYIIDIFENDKQYASMCDNAFYSYKSKYSSERYYERLMLAISD
ncbi:MAG TPA: glycosyltransferase [Bacteroidales bacterium]|nr:glycosyltransferase [Bacteroidales bacterium]